MIILKLLSHTEVKMHFIFIALLLPCRGAIGFVFSPGERYFNVWAMIWKPIFVKEVGQMVIAGKTLFKLSF